MPPNLRARFRALVFLCVAMLFSGCVTAKKYKMAKEGGVPPVPLSLSVTTPDAELAVPTVIVVKGPGSWKREARWDEYVVRLSNSGEQPLTVGSVELFDLNGAPRLPGTEPWQLEKLSTTNWQKYGSTGVQVLAGAGLAATYVGIELGTAIAAWGGGSAAATGGAAVALTVIPVFAVVNLTTVAIMNHNNKQKVMAEFNRRRLPVPLTVAPGGVAEGSYFFPMTPGPQRLVMKGVAGGNPIEVILELKPLADLHLKPVAKK
jgi:hypothetical protein